MDNMLILHSKCDQNVLSKNSLSTVNQSSQCSQDVITGFQVPLPPVPGTSVDVGGTSGHAGTSWYGPSLAVTHPNSWSMRILLDLRNGTPRITGYASFSATMARTTCAFHCWSLEYNLSFTHSVKTTSSTPIASRARCGVGSRLLRSPSQSTKPSSIKTECEPLSISAVTATRSGSEGPSTRQRHSRCPKEKGTVRGVDTGDKGSFAHQVHAEHIAITGKK